MRELCVVCSTYVCSVCMDTETPKKACKGRQGDYISMSAAGQSGGRVKQWTCQRKRVV